MEAIGVAHQQLWITALYHFTMKNLPYLSLKALLTSWLQGFTLPWVCHLFNHFFKHILISIFSQYIILLFTILVLMVTFGVCAHCLLLNSFWTGASPWFFFFIHMQMDANACEGHENSFLFCLKIKDVYFCFDWRPTLTLYGLIVSSTSYFTICL